MARRKKSSSRLAEALAETAQDMHGIGILGDEAYEKITMRHLGADKGAPLEPLTGEEIRAMRERAHMSQAVFAHHLNLTVGYVSQIGARCEAADRPHARAAERDPPQGDGGDPLTFQFWTTVLPS